MENGTALDTLIQMERDIAFSKRLEAGLSALGRSQSDLARELGITRQRLSQMKAGERPGRKHLPGLAKAIGCSVEWLLNGTGERPSWSKTQDGHASKNTEAVPADLVAAQETWSRLRKALSVHEQNQAIIDRSDLAPYPLTWFLEKAKEIGLNMNADETRLAGIGYALEVYYCGNMRGEADAWENAVRAGAAALYFGGLPAVEILAQNPVIGLKNEHPSLIPDFVAKKLAAISGDPTAS
jgi:transcriptional regulator with XRE-family HTH domain